MATPRKRTARKTTTSRRRATAKSGRSNTSFLAMGMIAGLAVAILFYTIFIRQDANLSKSSGSQYAHTPNQPHLLNPLPPRPREALVPADKTTQSPASRSLEPVPQTKPPISIAESTAGDRTSPAANATAPQTTTSGPAPAIAPSTPSKPASEPKQPPITEDPIGNLIAQNERTQKSPTPTRQVTPSATKDDADHVGALIKTMPSDNSTTTTITTTKSATVVAAVPEKTIALSPAPTQQQPFYLQTGPYKSENEADAIRAELLLLGHSNATVHKALVNNQTVYRVRIGPYTSSNTLNKTQKALEATKLKLSPVH